MILQKDPGSERQRREGGAEYLVGVTTTVGGDSGSRDPVQTVCLIKSNLSDS